MFVRRTQTRATANGERYVTHRLVFSERRGSRVRQRTLLNLGRHCALPQADWPLLCSCVEQILSSQPTLALAEVPRAVEREAHRVRLTSLEINVVPLAKLRSANSFTCSKIDPSPC